MNIKQAIQKFFSLFIKSAVMLCFLFSVKTVSAQTPAFLYCASNEPNGDVNLKWNPSSDPCGAFVSYAIYYATAKNGPYTLLSTITNEAQTSDLHAGANGKNVKYYYYIAAFYNCPTSPLNSDTIDNRQIPSPVINYVTVNNGQSEINWEQSSAPNIHAYVVYLKSGINTYIPIDTVYGGSNTTYTDIINDPKATPQEYSVAAVDSCWQFGLINDSAQKTIFITGDADPCTGRGTVQWTPYLRWPEGVQIYRLYAKYDGGAAVLLDSTAALSDTFEYTTQDICLFVVAQRRNSTFTSASPEFCLDGNPNHPIKDLQVHTVTVQDIGTNRIYYSVSEQSDILTIYIERSEDGQTYTSLTSFAPPPSLSGLLFFDDENAINEERAYYYRIRMKDNCGKEITSNYAKTILLKGDPFSNFTNNLNWDAYENGYGTVDSYELQRNGPAGWSSLKTINGTDTREYNDEKVETLLGDSGTLCYQVIASATIIFPNGESVAVTSNSNIKCLDQFIRVGMPTAFAPEGVNRIFKPVLRFTGNKSYIFKVFDRWGGTIFSTANFDEGWDGTIKGKDAPQGAYAYYVQVVDNTGSKTEDKGVVMLLR